MPTVINQQGFEEWLRLKLNTEMQAAAEPVIQMALVEVEKEMRKKVAEKIIATITSEMVLERFGPDLRILVKGFGG
ncbi:MAG TPA: hypothetical protein DCS09_11085 [Porphyromonadaceae bacterium]|nr:hypothetical protein [Porphyromonadaceae bacterium]